MAKSTWLAGAAALLLGSLASLYAILTISLHVVNVDVETVKTPTRVHIQHSLSQTAVQFNETFMASPPLSSITHIRTTESTGKVQLWPHSLADKKKNPAWRMRLVGLQIKMLHVQRKNNDNNNDLWWWEANYQVECPGNYTIEIISEHDDWDDELITLHNFQYRMFSTDGRPFLTPYEMKSSEFPSLINFQSQISPTHSCQLRSNSTTPSLATTSTDERHDLPLCSLSKMNMKTASWVVTDKNETWVNEKLKGLSVTNSSKTREWVMDDQAFGGIEFRFESCRMLEMVELNAILLNLPEPHTSLPPIQDWPAPHRPLQLPPVYKTHPPQQMNGWKAPPYNAPAHSRVCFNGDSQLEYLASYASGTFFYGDENSTYPANYTSAVFYRDSWGTQLCYGLRQTKCDAFVFNFGHWPLTYLNNYIPIRPWNASEYESTVRNFMQILKTCDTLTTLYWIDSNANSYTRTQMANTDFRTDAGIQSYNAIARKVAEEQGVKVLEFYNVTGTLKDLSFDMNHFYGTVGYELARIVLTAVFFPE